MADKPETLILGSRHDLTCDFVVAALRRRGVSYLRLNSEDLPDTSLDLDPTTATMAVDIGGREFHLSEGSLRSVLFRRPTFLRCFGDCASKAKEGLLKAHWAAFLRSLMLFERATWVNHPRSTYFAEHKPLQLRRAYLLGFDVPRTRVANGVARIREPGGAGNRVVVKGLDTVLLRNRETEMFGFTQFADINALREEDFRSAPVILQEALEEKVDLRVSVVGDKVFAVEISQCGQPIPGDWRCMSREATYTPLPLPEDLQQKCIGLVASLGLSFGAIDLARQHDRYYFLEVNPTGEWAWLVDAAGLAIDQAVADLLVAPQ